MKFIIPFGSLVPSRNSLKSLMASSVTQTLTLPQTQTFHSDPPQDDLDDLLCSDPQQEQQERQQLLLSSPDTSPSCFGSPSRCLTGESHFERAWAHWAKLGRPKLIVAPMVDNSELPFRMLCRKYGAEAAYTPMLHSRIFTENEKYRNQEFTTCKEDRPLFVQFCANDPDILLEAARKVEPFCDYVDINLGCPQRIARRGNYGAFLMDNLPLVKCLVQKLAHNLHVPVSCKIRVFPDLQVTINYARMLEDAGCSLLAVHGRTRDEKDGKKFRADWKAIKAVKNALRIPVLANGNIRHMDDVQSCLEETGADGVLSAETLLENPALFAGYQTAEWVVGSEGSNREGQLDQTDLVVEYLKFCESYPVPWRMIRSHVHKMLGDWFRMHPHVREDLNSQSILSFEFLYNMVERLRELGTKIPLYLKDTHEDRIAADGLGSSSV
ncbi:tRNA-dihydrouridine(16/17) synthase [NAD(P)(+)]-like [Morella rubra]|uniref:tRNA-dihydrouridine(16/17) synthase [NAD(P)(+)] n=1 Tax=Morella rubra TaxID=262757 RepID=A0A6A1VS39_9ROSI|nr:tRNA-dihydrouridine(16/17) synthase [NAD(P)(+)]-like [Morella rubra]KAB1214766.1 tRNA-dihydrouridine(16/17) synthase [NAD(P)(+)]-like [Morella rubra]